jgi:hypothetical protein
MPEFSRRSLLGAAVTDAVSQFPASQCLALAGHHVP